MADARREEVEQCPAEPGPELMQRGRTHFGGDKDRDRRRKAKTSRLDRAKSFMRMVDDDFKAAIDDKSSAGTSKKEATRQVAKAAAREEAPRQPGQREATRQVARLATREKALRGPGRGARVAAEVATPPTVVPPISRCLTDPGPRPPGQGCRRECVSSSACREW
eukprot:CAMPEP_0204586800 /NCGR_PEP_ID=MMETSP0661-20131031/47704_1 /ASSEMBLY_ACC=CAM_ASM_000606 /TAXON_ID=109239 /ORGANISM="Alexandrium margalefi, Strain AMGDE01CS-322" /LENGTH=164 /DNA_ID=CAMNT_0051596475 /DNA_START=56 /DNA_END=551 /DNA_ORIENTATION=-